MKDEKTPEQDVFEDLDKMYQRVADIEKEEAGGAAEPPLQKREKPKPKEKRSSRPIMLVALIVCLILAGFFGFPFLKQTVTSLLPKKSKTPPAFLTTPPALKPKPSAPLPVSKVQEPLKTVPEQVQKPKPMPPAPAPVPKEQEAMKTPPKEVQKAKLIPPAPPQPSKEQESVKIPPKEMEKTKPLSQEIKKSPKPLEQEYYTIQTGAFHSLEYARDRFEMLKKDGLDAYLTKIEGKKRGTFYKVFVGHFKNEKEGTRFLAEKGILGDYPGSFVRKEPSFEVHQLIEGNLAM
ncbi:MAG: SPOR domain-containing protein [Thermodesulfobacteriota bacterium]